METQPGAEALAARHEPESFVQGMAGRLAESANVRTVYGNPVDRDGTTVIPVANVRYGFGGGTGRKPGQGPQPAGEGMGGGAGVQVSPVGYIEICEGRVKFRRIRLASTLVRGLGIGLGVLFIARAISEVTRRRRTFQKLASLPAEDRRRVAGMWALVRAMPRGERRSLARRLKALRRT